MHELVADEQCSIVHVRKTIVALEGARGAALRGILAKLEEPGDSTLCSSVHRGKNRPRAKTIDSEVGSRMCG